MSQAPKYHVTLYQTSTFFLTSKLNEFADDISKGAENGSRHFLKRLRIFWEKERPLFVSIFRLFYDVFKILLSGRREAKRLFTEGLSK